MSQAAKSLVLLGDPQQLDQPKKGSHPDGVEVSVLEHILHGAKTMPESQGIFLGETWRFGSAICAFTSEVFYESKLHPTTARGLEQQTLTGGPIEGAGLFVLEVDHDGNRNGSDEEVEVIASLVTKLLAPGSTWTDHTGAVHQMAPEDIRVVSPYNVQVSRLAEKLPVGVPCGTVDKFQGQEAPVAIYSMATSRPEDAPRGMEFLYSLNRLNVATSRAKCAAILVASPRIFEPECKTPRQIQLANALCRFREMAKGLATPKRALRSQTVTLDAGRGRHRKYAPYAFTEQGVAMLSSVLRSPRAVAVNIEIIRAFVELRRVIESTAGLSRRLDVLERKYD
jgi:uncharacterized protein